MNSVFFLFRRISKRVVFSLVPKVSDSTQSFVIFYLLGEYVLFEEEKHPASSLFLFPFRESTELKRD
ncbi:hypothetical protein [Leptospira idonii]|uniref:Uncharacterized protein n=1 Tax=Leptospira idonii TaxID=1193500 RepID=A0A4R9M378_9LEPT|nr:hypothetical protein [Leptospira idonii]TGN20582.1 hypothetical protein EHS15_03035 [Leptospira idonii]